MITESILTLAFVIPIVVLLSYAVFVGVRLITDMKTAPSALSGVLLISIALGLAVLLVAFIT